MYRHTESGKKLIELTEAFASDGFEVSRIVNKFGRCGVMAESKTAVNYDTKKRKKAYYIEGTGYEAGYLMGLLAENEIAAMTGDFTNKVVFSFIGSKFMEKIKLLQEALIKLVYELGKDEYARLPKELQDEIQGLYDGCRSHNPKTTVTLDRLIVLNLGIDILCSMIYSGDFPLFRLSGLEPEEFDVPVMCNAFSVFKEAAGGGHYFCRDFMFPTADVFHNVACMVIYNPIAARNNRVYPFVSITAPGMIGCISGMNSMNVGIGVDMSPGCNCDPRNSGINSLLMTRLCIQNGGSSEEMVDIIENTPRGVTWNYIISDGKNDKACVVEAGKSGSITDLTQLPVKEYRGVLPDADFISHNFSTHYRNGIMVRWNDYKYPEAYLKFNEGLWAHYNKLNKAEKPIYPEAFEYKGYINRTQKEKNCPSAFYFCPQREQRDDMILVTNHFVIPEMRYFAMHPWTSKITGHKADDIQWRYDELNSLILEELQQREKITFNSAKRLISFLSPKSRNPGYYEKNPKSKDGKETVIRGCVTVFDLKNLYAESHYGYYCDDWVRITLPGYLT